MDGKGKGLRVGQAKTKNIATVFRKKVNAVSEDLYYRLHVFICTHHRSEDHPLRSCGHYGSDDLRTYLKRRVHQLRLSGVRINSSGCLNRCALGPVMVIYPEGIWYSFSTQEDIDEILQTHLIDGHYVERLRLKPNQQPQAS